MLKGIVTHKRKNIMGEIETFEDRMMKQYEIEKKLLTKIKRIMKSQLNGITPSELSLLVNIPVRNLVPKLRNMVRNRTLATWNPSETKIQLYRKQYIIGYYVDKSTLLFAPEYTKRITKKLNKLDKQSNLSVEDAVARDKLKTTENNVEQLKKLVRKKPKRK